MKRFFQRFIIFALVLGMACGLASCGSLPKGGSSAASGNSGQSETTESTVLALPYSEPQKPRAVLDMPSSGASSARTPAASDTDPAASAGNTSGNSGSELRVPNRKITVCIDPGHYHGASYLTGENLYDYEEAYATLKIGQELSRILKEDYGIESYLTRTGDSISLNGYTDD